jgi:hypothetical protein
MRPNLSLSQIANVLSAIGGAAVLTACGGSPTPATTPANANEITHTAPGVSGQSSCSAKGCGAKAGEGQGQSSCGAKSGPDGKGNVTGAAPGGGAAPPANTASPDPKKAEPDKKTAVLPTTTATAPTPTPAPAPTTKPKVAPKPTGQASCGAGTCAADPKKK